MLLTTLNYSLSYHSGNSQQTMKQIIFMLGSYIGVHTQAIRWSHHSTEEHGDGRRAILGSPSDQSWPLEWGTGRALFVRRGQWVSPDAQGEFPWYEWHPGSQRRWWWARARICLHSRSATADIRIYGRYCQNSNDEKDMICFFIGTHEIINVLLSCPLTSN